MKEQCIPLKVIAVIDVEDYFYTSSRTGEKLCGNILACCKSKTTLSWVLLAALCCVPAPCSVENSSKGLAEGEIHVHKRVKLHQNL